MVVEVRGIPVNYIVCGEGEETAVILQGWGTNLGLYRDLAEHLGKRMRVYVPELPGFGETPEPREPMDAEDYAAFTLDLLRSLGIREAHLIGHSNGGRIMLVLASEERDVKFRKLVFLDSAGIVPPKTAKKKLRGALFKLGRTLLTPFPKALEKYRQSHGSADYRAASGVMRQTLVKLVNRDLRDRMPKIQNPSLLIWGENDTDTPLWMGKLFEELIPDAGLVTVPGAGHYAYLEKPQFVFRVLDSFFGGN
ncbi:MAG: alpha/beta hydrolase [Oscillospiraceae bacterium]|nr:alpha/beta hydrolase [Oscillospiraceae bacterium]